MSGIKFTPESLSQTFQKYHKELIIQPMFALEPALKHMSVRTGIRYKEHVSSLDGKFEFSNYKKDRMGTGDVEIAARTLETFFGNCIEPIDPNSIYQSIWGSNITKGKALKDTEIVKAVCAFIMKQLGENMLIHLYDAKHVDNEDGTVNWFNGFKSINLADIASGELNEEDKNLKYLDKITEQNAEDVIKDFFWGAHHILRGQQLKLFMSDMTYHHYTEAYQMNHGSLPYNQSYDKRTLEGASNVEIVPLPCVPDDYLELTTKTNKLLLFNQKTDDEKFIVEKSLQNHYDVDFIANMFFGTQLLSIQPRTYRVGMVKPAGDQGGN